MIKDEKYTALIIGCAALAYIIIRVWYWSIYGKGKDFNSDGYYSLLCINRYKKNGRRRFSQVPNMVIPTTDVYPSLGIWILSFFSENFIFRFGGLMNSAIDLVYFALLCLMYIKLHVTSWSLILGLLVFLFLPTNFNKNPTNSMHFSITWRDLGRLTATSYYVTLFCAMLWPEKIVLFSILSTLAFLACFYTSQFALQSVIFGSVFFSMLSANMLPIIILLTGHAVVVVTDWKHIKRYYVFKYNHFKTYFRLWRHTHDQVTNDYAFSFKHLRIVASHLFHFQFSYASINAVCDPFTRGIYLLPIQLTTALGLYMMHDNTSSLLLQWYGASCIVWFLTLTPWLKIFGEPDRYLEFFGYMPILIGLGYCLPTLYSEHIFLFCFTLILAAFQFHFVIADLLFRRKNKGQTTVDLHHITKLRAEGDFLQGKNLYPITFSYAWKIAYIFDAPTLYPPFENVPVSDFIGNYPYPKYENLAAVCGEYNISYLIIEKEYQELLRREEIKKLSSESQIIGDFIVVKVIV